MTHMLTGAVAKQITDHLKEELLLTYWYELATDGTSDEDDKFWPLLVRYVDKYSGLIATSLLDMQNISSSLTAQQMYDLCNQMGNLVDKRLVNALKQPVSKLCAMFIQFVIPIFDSLNTSRMR